LRPSDSTVKKSRDESCMTASARRRGAKVKEAYQMVSNGASLIFQAKKQEEEKGQPTLGVFLNGVFLLSGLEGLEFQVGPPSLWLWGFNRTRL